MTQKTTLPKKTDIDKDRKWHFMDATNRILGRLSSETAVLLAGKHKKYYTPFLDCGDFVVITNASRIKLTGNKANRKTYFRHSGYAKGARIISFKSQMEKDPAKVVFLAVKRMLDSNNLRARRLKRLKIFKGEQNQFSPKG